MNDYSIALFLHIAGVLGLSVSLGLEWTGLRQIRNAVNPEQVRGWMGILKGGRKFGMAAMLTAVITGLYMMYTAWNGEAWIWVSIGSLALVIILALVLTGPRMKAMGQALMMGKGALTKAFYSAANNSLLWVSIQTRVALALGIVFLKITKPDLAGSLITIGAAIVLGVASVVPLPRGEQAPAGTTH